MLTPSRKLTALELTEQLQKSQATRSCFLLFLKAMKAILITFYAIFVQLYGGGYPGITIKQEAVENTTPTTKGNGSVQ